MNSELLAIAVLVKSQNIESSFVRDLKIADMLVGSGMSWTLIAEVNEILKNL